MHIVGRVNVKQVVSILCLLLSFKGFIIVLFADM